jgi:hypothetical protein
VCVLGLLVLELAWFAWFLAVPLPNFERVRRWVFLARALPEVVPGIRFSQSYLGLGLKELGHVENLAQRLPIVLAAGLIGASALALGRLGIRALGLRTTLGPGERLGLGYGLGMTGLGVITLILGRLGALAPWPFRIGLGLLILAEGALTVRDRRGYQRASDLRSSPSPLVGEGRGGGWGEGQGTRPPTLTLPQKGGGDQRMARDIRTRPTWLPWLGFGLVVGPFLVIMALGSMLPTIDFDAIEYHLQGPKEYFRAGRIAFLPHNVYTSMPFGVEMLHLLGMEVLNDWWWGALAGQLLVASFAPATAGMIALTALRIGSPRAAWVAAVVYLTTPWVYRLAVIPYVEGPLCYYHAALVWAAFRASSAEADGLRARLWGVAGLLAGGAMACKYPALISAVVPFGLLALVEAFRRRSARVALAFGLGWAVVMAPWLGRNLIDTGNPVYPLAYKVFGGRHWDAAREAKWSSAHGPRPVSAGALAGSLVDVAGRSDWQSPLYLALAPLALVRPGSRRQAGALWGYVAYLFLTWWLLTHRLDRFWLPLLPPLAVLAGLGADWTRHRAWLALLGLLLALALLTNLSYCSTALVGFNEWTGDLPALRSQVPRLLNPPLVRLDETLPDGSRVLLVGQAAVFHFNHPIVYNTVFNEETFETLTRDRTPAQIRQNLAARGITHVYVDWYEIDRYRSPGNYGFTDYVTPEVLARLVAQGVLGPAEPIGERQELYPVRP